MNLWLTVADVARRLSVTPDTVRDLERRGRLRAIRTAGGVRLFQEAEVKRFIEARKTRRPPTEAARS